MIGAVIQLPTLDEQPFENRKQLDCFTQRLVAAFLAMLAMAADAAFNTAGDTTVTFPNTSLGRQLRQVARIIKDSLALNVTRQIFVQVAVLTRAFEPDLGPQGGLTTVGQALRCSFWDELGFRECKIASRPSRCRILTGSLNPASQFGCRNGLRGKNHMLVLGGSVIGAIFCSAAGWLRQLLPNPYFGRADDVDTNRWHAAVPTTSVEQYAAQLARWYGLSQDPATLAAVFPNLTNFPGTYAQLGFLP